MLEIVLDPDRTWWTSIDHGVGKLGPAEAGIRKARGVRAGLPDIMIMSYGEWPPLIGIELKAGDGKLSPAQIEVAHGWRSMGFPIDVARSLEEVQQILVLHRIPMRRRMKFFGGNHGRPLRSAPARHPGAQRRRKSKGAVSVVQ